MKKELAEFIVDLFEEYTDFEVSLNEEYSGRGMFGETTSGIVVDESPDKAVQILLAEILYKHYKDGINENEELLKDLLNLVIATRYSQDSMGHDYIFY